MIVSWTGSGAVPVDPEPRASFAYVAASICAVGYLRAAMSSSQLVTVVVVWWVIINIPYGMLLPTWLA